jgi:hypothetical protein
MYYGEICTLWEAFQEGKAQTGSCQTADLGGTESHHEEARKQQGLQQKKVAGLEAGITAYSLRLFSFLQVFNQFYFFVDCASIHLTSLSLGTTILLPILMVGNPLECISVYAPAREIPRTLATSSAHSVIGSWSIEVYIVAIIVFLSLF